MGVSLQDRSTRAAWFGWLFPSLHHQFSLLRIRDRPQQYGTVPSDQFLAVHSAEVGSAVLVFRYVALCTSGGRSAGGHGTERPFGQHYRSILRVRLQEEG